MKLIQIILFSLVVFGCTNSNKNKNLREENNNLIVIDQNFDKALEIAIESNKLLFIDFYTSWCAPCKKLDKLVFQNDSIRQVLGGDFVLLKYDAENDTVFHLSKKHHVSGYPTGIVLNPTGHTIDKKYSFSGNDFETLSRSVLEFTERSKELNAQNKFLKGYSNTISAEKYPKFYVDFVERTNVRPDKNVILNFINSKEDFFDEEDFSTLFYFANDVSSNAGDILLKDKQKYLDLYGELDVGQTLYKLVVGKFNDAISKNNQQDYDNAVVLMKNTLGEERAANNLPRFELQWLKAQNKWIKVFEIYEKRKVEGDMDDGGINHICWDAYRNCDNQTVIAKCIEWMRDVTNKTPNYAYLDTYSFLLSKAGSKKLAIETAERGLKAAKEEGEDAKSLIKLIEKLRT